MASPCRRVDLVQFERAGQARNALGVVEESGWTVLFSFRASVRWGSSSERRAAGLEGALQSVTFRILADGAARSITAKDRAYFDDKLWDITGIVPVGAQSGRAELEITATAAIG